MIFMGELLVSGRVCFFFFLCGIQIHIIWLDCSGADEETEEKLRTSSLIAALP